MRVVTERRHRPFVIGVCCCVAGLAITLGGAAVAFATQALEVAAAVGRAEVANPVRFEATSETYGIILLPDATGVSSDQIPVQNLRCSVTHPDGTTEEVSTSSSSSRLETSAGREVGSFEGRAGTTEVTCSWADSRSTFGQFYSVAETNEGGRLLGMLLLVGGVLVIGVGVVLVIVGVRGRSVRVPNRAS